jgi:hypothetical protein
MNDQKHAGRSNRTAAPARGPAAAPGGRGLSPEQLQAAMKVYAANAAAAMRAGALRQRAGPAAG